MSYQRCKELQLRALEIGGPLTSPAQWSALRAKVRVDQSLSAEERELVEIVMDRTETHPEELPALRQILGKMLRR